MIALGENQAYAAEVPFFWPLATDPIGAGLTAHDFTLNATTGEVQVMLPGTGVWIKVPAAQIVEKGFGRYCVRLTPAQTLASGMVYISAVTADSSAQPYYGFEEIGVRGGDIAIDSDDTYNFFLPNATDPVFGTPIEGHAFVDGEVQVSLPNGSYANADVSDISEIGLGTYALRFHGSATSTRGKAFVYVLVTGSQRSEGFVTILSPGGIVVPSPSTGAASDIADQEARFYGEDIWFDVAAADPTTGKADYVVTAAGDWALATGLEALRQSLLRRLITDPREWPTAGDYGVGAQQWVKRPNTPANIAELESRIRAQFMRDDRVDSVSTVQISPLDDADGIKITVFVVAAGRLRQDKPLPVSIFLER